MTSNETRKDTLTPWEKVQLVRRQDRPNGKYYIETIFDEFIELHGDRHYGDDPAIIGGIASLDGESITVLAHQKGTTTKERIACNFGMAHPEGYRKSMRLMQQAEKFHRPIVCFIDTPGAFCGIGAEERGEGETIARSLMLMSSLKTPIISIIIGEGGSGGALAMGVADRIYMLENAVYSVLSPEGFASVLWKDGKRANEAASVMKLTAKELKQFGLIDGILPEAKGGGKEWPKRTADTIRKMLITELKNLQKKEISLLLEERYERFRKL